MYINKNSRIVCHVQTNESGRAYLNSRSLCSEQNQINLRDLIGEKERSAFRSECSERWQRTPNFCSDRSERSDLWKRTQPTCPLCCLKIIFHVQSSMSSHLLSSVTLPHLHIQIATDAQHVTQHTTVCCLNGWQMYTYNTNTLKT